MKGYIQQSQVKIRGFRIELGEIEVALSQYPIISQTTVTIEGEGDNKQLVAYLVLVKEQLLTIEKLRSYLKEKLPEYMIPSSYVVIESFPLTLNGKIDKKVLFASKHNKLEVSDNFIAPRNPIEEMLAGIWCEVLHLEKVSINDSFFELGGHSLLAIQLVLRIQKSFQINITLRKIFQHSTIAELAKEIEILLHQQDIIVLLPVTDTDISDSLPLCYAQIPFWFSYLLRPQSSSSLIKFSYYLKGKLNTIALEKSINQIIERHSAFRIRFTIVKGRAFQQVIPKLTLPLPVIDLTSLSDNEKQLNIEQLVKEEQKPINLTKDSLIRVKLVQIEKELHLFLLNIHHIIFDGWSTTIFFKELALFYEAYASEKEPSLMKKPVQYINFVDWQNRLLQSDLVKSQLSYWKEKLAGDLTIAQLPAKKLKPKLMSKKGAINSLILSKELTKDLIELCQKESVTMFMILVTAFKCLIYNYTKQNDLLLITYIANRSRLEFEDTIGLFVNGLPLRTYFSISTTFLELLHKVKETVLGAYSNSDIPGQKLIETFAPNNIDTIHKILGFNYHSLHKESFSLLNINTEPLPSKTVELPMLDIILHAIETDEGLELLFKYNLDVFDEAFIKELLNQLVEILVKAVS
ncbi:MAG: amino acid adenylation enzyme/thioester reductase family protein [bacterium]|nr:MAG: amino acid adenylation enzyme/thioester reductase family protein [bacterium]